MDTFSGTWKLRDGSIAREVKQFGDIWIGRIGSVDTRLYQWDIKGSHEYNRDYDLMERVSSNFKWERKQNQSVSS